MFCCYKNVIKFECVYSTWQILDTRGHYLIMICQGPRKQLVSMYSEELCLDEIAIFYNKTLMPIQIVPL